MAKKKSEYQKFAEAQKRRVNKVGKTVDVSPDSTKRRFASLKQQFDEAVLIGKRLEKQGVELTFQKSAVERLVRKIEKLN